MSSATKQNPFFQLCDSIIIIITISLFVYNNKPNKQTKQKQNTQVKTTQPRRYLVRPNQGLIRPGQKETVTILLVEKDKNQLLTSYASLGAAALDHCKDKFLVQSVAVSAAQADELKEYDELTALWTSIQSGGGKTSNNPTSNKKLHVKHKVADGAGGTGGGSDAAGSPALAVARVEHPERLNKEELVVEWQNLRRKYDELVAFSVNLTAERDVLNNTLEQTKRDLNREMNSHAASNKHANRGAAATTRPSTGPGMMTVLIYVVTALLLGAKLQQMGLLHGLPGFSDEETAASPQSTSGYSGSGSEL